MGAGGKLFSANNWHWWAYENGVFQSYHIGLIAEPSATDHWMGCRVEPAGAALTCDCSAGQNLIQGAHGFQPDAPFTNCVCDSGNFNLAGNPGLVSWQLMSGTPGDLNTEYFEWHAFYGPSIKVIGLPTGWFAKVIKVGDAVRTAADKQQIESGGEAIIGVVDGGDRDMPPWDEVQVLDGSLVVMATIQVRTFQPGTYGGDVYCYQCAFPCPPPDTASFFFFGQQVVQPVTLKLLVSLDAELSGINSRQVTTSLDARIGEVANWNTWFTEYDHEADVLPSDFTLRWDSGSGDWIVTEEKGAIGLNDNTGGAADEDACSWDVPGGGGDPTGGIELYYLVQHQSSFVRARGTGSIIRGSGSAGSEKGYLLSFKGNSDEMELLRYKGDGTKSSLALVDSLQEEEEFWWWRFQVSDEGGDVRLKARAWKFGDSEPGTWGIDFLDTSADKITTDGWVGFLCEDNDSQYAFFSASENGDPAIPLGEDGVDSSENFSGGTVGNPMAGFDDRWHDTDFTVETDAGSDGGKSLQDSTSTTDRRGHVWETPGAGRDMDVLIEFETSVIGDEIGCSARQIGDSVDENGLVAYVANGNQLWVIEFYDGRTDNLGVPTISYSADEKLQIRLRVIGSSVKARFWKSADAEPGTWDVDATTLKVMSGFPGISGLQYDGVKVHRIAVAYGGGSAAFS